MILYAFVLTLKDTKEYGMSETYTIFQHVSLHEIDIQLQRLAENVLNRAPILLSNCSQLFFPLCTGFSNCLNGDLLSLVF